MWILTHTRRIDMMIQYGTYELNTHAAAHIMYALHSGMRYMRINTYNMNNELIESTVYDDITPYIEQCKKQCISRECIALYDDFLEEMYSYTPIAVYFYQ
jgi:hypothetical protein